MMKRFMPLPRRRLQWGLATKQFIVLSCASLFLFLAMTTIDSIQTVRAFQGQLMGDSQLFITQTNQYLDAYVNNIENILLMVSTRSDLLSQPETFSVERQLQQYADLDGGVIRTVYLLGLHGHLLTNQPVPLDILGNPHLPGLIKLATQNYGGINWSEPYWSPVSGQTTVAFVRSVVGRNGERVGTAIVEIDLAQLKNDLASVLGGSFQDFVVLTTRGHVVTYNIQKALVAFETMNFPPAIQPSFVRLLQGAPSGASTLNTRGLPLVLVRSDTNMLGWSIVDVIQKSLLYETVHQLFLNFATVAMVWFTILLTGAFLFSRLFTAPIRKLTTTMDAVMDLYDPPYIVSKRTDEIGRLASSYNRLMDRIQGLVRDVKIMEQKKKEYELRMLQSQIGPHFLYNTLMCIGSLSRQQKLMEVTSTIRALIRLISFSFDKVSSFVTLENEMEALRMYIHIQKVRYGDTFEVDYDLDPRSLLYQLPKLTLQPIVENAIFHGIVPLGGFGRIVVRSRIRKNRLHILISDNGVGMSKEQVSALFTDPQQVNRMPYELNKIGVRNVNERLGMHFGNDGGLRIRSHPGRGTVVQVRLPVLAAGLDDQNEASGGDVVEHELTF